MITGASWRFPPQAAASAANDTAAAARKCRLNPISPIPPPVRPPTGKNADALQCKPDKSNALR